MTKSIAIIGAGIGGLASGIHGQVNVYNTRIFEMHNLPGGSVRPGSARITPSTAASTTSWAALHSPGHTNSGAS